MTKRIWLLHYNDFILPMKQTMEYRTLLHTKSFGFFCYYSLLVTEYYTLFHGLSKIIIRFVKKTKNKKTILLTLERV